MEGSSQKWLGRNRPPRVQITYDVEIGNAIEKKELPLVVGILADLAGTGGKGNLPEVKDRKFVEIDRDNFDNVMASIGPRLTKLRVHDRMGKDPNKEIEVDLGFSKLEDFRPEKIVEHAEIGGVKMLNDLLVARRALNDLIAKVDGREKLAELLCDIVQDDKKRAEVEKGLLPAPKEVSE